MAGKIPDLHVEPRTGTGKGAARQTRRKGYVPGVVYGDGKDPVTIEIPFNTLFMKLKQGRFLSTLFNMKLEGEPDVRVICRDVQRDVVKGLPRHVDFMRLRQTSRVDIFITVEFVNEEECPGIKKGGVLTVVRPEIELNVVANNIPEKIEVDLTGLEVGDVITISDITLPKGARPTIDRDFTICNISAPSALRSAEEEEAEAEEAAALEAEAEGKTDAEATEE